MSNFKANTTTKIAPAQRLDSSSPARTKLVIIIPALNEEKTISKVIDGIPPKMANIDECEVVVIDDGSQDKTVQRALQSGASVVQHHQNMGVGAAFHTGIKEALKKGADIIVNIDADGQFNPTDIPKITQPIYREEAEFVTATRFSDPNNVPDMPGIKLWGNRMMVHLINFITKKGFTDVSCGFRAYSREAALRLTLFGHFTYTQETFIDLAFKNINMMEVPMVVRGEREFGKSRVASNLWRYGTKAASIIIRAARDYRPHYFFGIPGLISFAGGISSGLFLVAHYFPERQIFPYRSLVQVSAMLIIVGFLLIVLSMLADMMHRNRVVAEEAVYHARKKAYEKPSK